MTEAAAVQGAARPATVPSAVLHDFNNLLAVVIDSLDVLRRSRPGDTLVGELTGEALEAAWQGADLIRRLQAAANPPLLHPQPVHLTAIVAGMAPLLSRLLGPDIAVVADLAPDLVPDLAPELAWPVLADPAQVEAAILNLARNARLAMPQGGRLTLTTRRHTVGPGPMQGPRPAAGDMPPPGEYAMLAIADTGACIAAENLARVLDPFFVLKGDRGSGMRLSAVSGFVRNSGGHMTVHSAPDTGTVLRIFLPRLVAVPDTNPSATKLSVAPVAAAPGRGDGPAILPTILPTILVVDDNAKMRKVVVRTLARLGYRVLDAGDAAAAVALLGREQVDLLLTDVVMPGGTDGCELARQACLLRPGLRVLLTSGFNGPEIDAASAAGPPFPLLGKPYRIEALAQAVRAALQS